MARLFDGDPANRLTLDAPTRAMGSTPPPNNSISLFLLQAWVYPTTTINTDRTICAKGDDDGIEIELFIDSGGKANIRVDNWCVPKFWQTQGATTITPDRWWCITGFLDTLTFSVGDPITWIYVDGVDDSAVWSGAGYPNPLGMCNQDAEVNIGARPDGAGGYERAWEGRIAEVCHVTGGFLQATTGELGVFGLMAGGAALQKVAGSYGFPSTAIRAYWQLFGVDGSDPEPYFTRENWIYALADSDIPVIGTLDGAPHAPVQRRHKLRGQ